MLEKLVSFGIKIFKKHFIDNKYTNFKFTETGGFIAKKKLNLL